MEKDWMDRLSTVLFYIAILMLVFILGVQVGKWSERNERSERKPLTALTASGFSHNYSFILCRRNNQPSCISRQ